MLRSFTTKQDHTRFVVTALKKNEALLDGISTSFELTGLTFSVPCHIAHKSHVLPFDA